MAAQGYQTERSEPFMVPRETRRAAGYAESEDSVGRNDSFKLRLRGTFIDTCDPDDDEQITSPRALSDPGSVSSGYSSYFKKERNYIDALSQKVSKTLSSKNSRLSRSSGGRSGGSDSETKSTEEASRTRSMPSKHPEDASRSVPLPPSAEALPPRHLPTRHRSKEQLAQTKFSRPAPSSNSSDNQSFKTLNSSFNSHIPSDMKQVGERITDAHSGRKKLSPEELRTLVHKKTNEINDVLSYQRLSTALTSINEIPEQVSEVVHQQRENWLDDIRGEISVARDLLVNRDQAEEQVAGEMTAERESRREAAAQSMTMIPDMIMASFENSFAKAMSTVRIRVDDVIQGLEGNEMAKEQVVKQMWAIPEEVRQITREAVKEASQESREKVVEQLDCVLKGFSEETMPDSFKGRMRQIVATVPKKLPDTLRAATEAAETNVCQAVKVVQDKTNVHGVLSNRVVADTLLRAKVGPSLQKSTADSPGLETLRVCNPGSVGHPELCSRACLYFPLGKCSNGMNCAFCHAPHTKRATHLDKRHREMLRAMNFSERYFLIHPVLKVKLENLEVGPDVMELIASLDVMASKDKPVVQEGQPVDRKKNKEGRTLQIALKFMSVRSLLTLLHHAPMPEGSPEHAAVEELLQKIRPDSTIQDYENRSEDNWNRSRTSQRSDRSARRSRTPSQGSDR